ncbi:hypothetical protein F9C29_11670, partial [Enterobacter hormaechei]
STPLSSSAASEGYKRQNEDPSEVIEFYGKNKELMDNMRNVALEEQAVEAVLAKAKVTEKETSFTELMNQQA